MKNDEAVEEWRLIETAPRDGTPVLATNASYGRARDRCKVVFWDEGEEGRIEAGWRMPQDDDDSRSHIHLTHWMPLPEPPTQTEATASAKAETRIDALPAIDWKPAKNAE